MLLLQIQEVQDLLLGEEEVVVISGVEVEETVEVVVSEVAEMIGEVVVEGNIKIILWKI